MWIWYLIHWGLICFGGLKKINCTAVPLDSSNSIWCSTHYRKVNARNKASLTCHYYMFDGRWASVCTKDNLFLLEKCQKKHIAQIFRRYLIIGFFFSAITHLIYIYTQKKYDFLKSVMVYIMKLIFLNMHIVAFLSFLIEAFVHSYLQMSFSELCNTDFCIDT